jgi:hypothetical protein
MSRLPHPPRLSLKIHKITILLTVLTYRTVSKIVVFCILICGYMPPALRSSRNAKTDFFDMNNNARDISVSGIGSMCDVLRSLSIIVGNVVIKYKLFVPFLSFENIGYRTTCNMTPCFAIEISCRAYYECLKTRTYCGSEEKQVYEWHKRFRDVHETTGFFCMKMHLHVGFRGQRVSC